MLRDPLSLEAKGCWDSLGAAGPRGCDAWLCPLDAGAGLTSGVLDAGKGVLLRDWCSAVSTVAVSGFVVGTARDALLDS